MKSPSGTRRVAAVLTMAVASLTMATPATAATSAGAALFSGTAGFWCTGRGGGVPYPLVYVTSDPSVTLMPPARQCSWSFGSTWCMGASATVLTPDDPLPIYGPLCAIAASGHLTGWCGLSRGSGAGGFSVTDPLTGASGTASLTDVGLVDVGGTWAIHSGVDGPTAGEKGTMVALFDTVPDPQTGSCETATATNFLIMGVAAFYASGETTVP